MLHFSAVLQCCTSVLCFSVALQCCASVLHFSAALQCCTSVLCFSAALQCCASVLCFSVVLQCAYILHGYSCTGFMQSCVLELQLKPRLWIFTFICLSANAIMYLACVWTLHPMLSCVAIHTCLSPWGRGVSIPGIVSGEWLIFCK